ncbi:MAG: hypothetical protein CMJ78_17335 [Planctomycetaceae bacterium]|nr:hypothetical protein [Planctomycetaceae bacterium]
MLMSFASRMQIGFCTKITDLMGCGPLTKLTRLERLTTRPSKLLRITFEQWQLFVALGSLAIARLETRITLDDGGVVGNRCIEQVAGSIEIATYKVGSQ